MDFTDVQDLERELRAEVPDLETDLDELKGVAILTMELGEYRLFLEWFPGDVITYGLTFDNGCPSISFTRADELIQDRAEAKRRTLELLRGKLPTQAPAA